MISNICPQSAWPRVCVVAQGTGLLLSEGGMRELEEKKRQEKENTKGLTSCSGRVERINNETIQIMFKED